MLSYMFEGNINLKKVSAVTFFISLGVVFASACFIPGQEDFDAEVQANINTIDRVEQQVDRGEEGYQQFISHPEFLNNPEDFEMITDEYWIKELITELENDPHKDGGGMYSGDRVEYCEGIRKLDVQKQLFSSLRKIEPNFHYKGQGDIFGFSGDADLLIGVIDGEQSQRTEKLIYSYLYDDELKSKLFKLSNFASKDEDWISTWVANKASTTIRLNEVTEKYEKGEVELESRGWRAVVDIYVDYPFLRFSNYREVE